MIEFDKGMIERAIAARSGEQKWRPDLVQAVSAICGWYVSNPDASVEYEDGRPGADMRRMLDQTSRDTGLESAQVLSFFGAAHCLLCDVVPGFRPALFSAWDRRDREDGH